MDAISIINRIKQIIDQNSETEVSEGWMSDAGTWWPGGSTGNVVLDYKQLMSEIDAFSATFREEFK